jgi:very-short-patch-repair endonuclease
VYPVSMKIHYNKKLSERAKTLRKNSTLSEIILWKQLKSKKMAGLDFHRQKPIDEYIVDFFCPKLRLIIEIDGSSHDNKCVEDEKRANRLKFLGFTMLRYSDKSVKRDLENVILSIRTHIESMMD